MVNEFRWRLRDATAADHQRLEDRIDIFTRIGTQAGRQDLVARFLNLHAAAEAAMAPHLSALDGLDFHARRRTPHLLADLKMLGVETPAAEVVADPPCAGRGEALGLLYVLEGSTLGGKTIRRRVEEGGGDMAGLSFLDPYGEEAGLRWRGFLQVLEREAAADPAVADGALAGALAGFRRAQATLCAAETVAS